MAEAAIGFAASVAGLAAFGIQIVTTLNTFATTYTHAEQQIRDLSANVALTASVLESVGKMIKEYEDRFQLTVDNYIATRDQCERNFNELWIVLKVVKKDESEKPSNLLTEDQSEDLKLFIRQLPALVLGLRQAGLMKAVERKRKSVENDGTDAVKIAMHVSNVELADSHLGATPNDSSGRENYTPPFNSNGEKEREITGINKTANTKLTHFHEPEIAEFHLTEPDSSTSSPRRSETTSRHSITTPPILLEPRDTNDTHSLYEGWLLEHDESPVTENIAILCGLKVKIYSASDVHGQYSIEPFSRDKKKLKSRVEEFGRNHDHGESQTKAQIKQLLKDLDEEARDEIEELLSDRNLNAREPYGWKIAAILDLPRNGSGRRAFWGHIRESKKSRRRLIVLKGGLIESHVEEVDDLPHRFSNPWGRETQRQASRSGAFTYGGEGDYRQRVVVKDLRNAGLDHRVLGNADKKERTVDDNGPTYTRMSRKHLSLETLNTYRIDYTLDEDPEYVIIKRWVPEYEQDFLWTHTKEIRERRQPVAIVIEDKKKHRDVEFEFVRKKQTRKTSPPTLLDFLVNTKGGTKEKSNQLMNDEGWQTPSWDNKASYPDDHGYISGDVGLTEDDPLLSHKEAEILMDKFLATFTSDDGDKAKNYKAKVDEESIELYDD